MGETTAAERERKRLYRLANREKIKEQARSYARSHREATAERARRYRAAHKENSRRSREELRHAVFDHYGWVCACCGSTKRPTIDHVNGDGREHRKQLFGNGSYGRTERFYRWLQANGFPEGFQTLCVPCNASKRDQPHCRLNHQE